jgi:hypothetical protein
MSEKCRQFYPVKVKTHGTFDPSSPICSVKDFVKTKHFQGEYRNGTATVGRSFSGWWF